MRFHRLVLVMVALLMKENSCVPAIRPMSQRGILFPIDNWDNCFVDNASSQPGLCKKLEDCTEVFKMWDKENVYPKTCYFIKKQQFVCCPIATSKEVFASTDKFDIFHTNPATVGVTEKPSNIFLQAVTINPPENANLSFTTQRPSNIFLNPVTKKPTENTEHPFISQRPSNIFLNPVTKKPTENSKLPFTTQRPSNIFLDKFKDTTTASSKSPSNIFLNSFYTPETTTKKQSFILPDIFNIFDTEKIPMKRRSEMECDLQNKHRLQTIDTNGAAFESTGFPYMALLGWKSNVDDEIWYPCGGVLVSSKFVLTSAHCAEIADENPIIVRLGDKNLTDSTKDTIKIKRFIIHPGYNATTSIYNDIALVELEQDVDIPRACLWTQHVLPLGELTALGYGHTRFNILSSNHLLKASLKVIENAECQDHYKLFDQLNTLDVTESHLCAGDEANIHGLCQGDTGGPLLMTRDSTFYVVGITSFGLGCADLPPSIYTRVSSFIDWLEPIIWPEIDIRIDKNK